MIGEGTQIRPLHGHETKPNLQGKNNFTKNLFYRTEYEGHKNISASQ